MESGDLMTRLEQSLGSGRLGVDRISRDSRMLSLFDPMYFRLLRTSSLATRAAEPKPRFYRA